MWILILGYFILNSCQVQKQSVKQTDLVYICFMWSLSWIKTSLTQLQWLWQKGEKIRDVCISQYCKGRTISTAGSDNGAQGSIQKEIPTQCVLVGATSPWQSIAHGRPLPDFLSVLMLYKQDKASLQILACGLFPKMSNLELSQGQSPGMDSLLKTEGTWL